MSQVSKYPISRDVYETISEALSKTIINLRTKSQVIQFFEEFLSPTERIMLAKRLAIGLLLAKEYSYREIRKILRVSTTTIGDAALLYKYGNSYREVILKLLKDEKMEEFWLKVGETISAAGAKGGSKSGAWVYLRNQLRKKRLKKAF